MAAGFVYGCLPPLVVSATVPLLTAERSGYCLGTLTSAQQAIYPTIIIVLVALKRSPIDTGGLSQIYQAHDHGDGAGPGGDKEARHTTIVFHHSTFCSMASGGTEDAMQDMRVSLSLTDGLTGRSRRSSMSDSEPDGHTKDIGKVV